VNAPLPAAPLWFRAGRALVRHLPAGRFRAFELLARRRLPPFEDRLGPEAGRLRYRCDLRHQVARETCLTGRYAPQEGALVRDSLRPGGTFVDVGANFGYFTLLAAAAVGPAGRVLALEPDPRMAAELEGNVERNRLPQVEVLAIAAAERDGTATLAGFAEEGGNWGVSSLMASSAEGMPTFTVRCAPLDDLLDAAGVDGVELVKVDVEGAEDRVLSGMRQGIRRRRYARVMVELHPWLHDYPAAALAGMHAAMEEAGYRGWLLEDDPAQLRRAYYGAAGLPPLRPLEGSFPLAGWPHLLWARPGAEPA
jgi:FkbM family methyltransferase